MTAVKESKLHLQWRARQIRLLIDMDRLLGCKPAATLDEQEQWLARLESEIDGLPD